MPCALVSQAASMPAEVHHADVLVEIVEQRVDGVARRALRVVMQDHAVARILLDQLARGEMVLEIDDHLRPLRGC